MVASILQILGAAIVVAAVFIANPVIGVGLAGVLLIVFGVALERRGKKGNK